MKTRVYCLLAAALLLSVPFAAWGQIGTSSVTGTVTDKSGAMVPAAKVACVNDATKLTYNTTTTEAGVYTFASLPVGSYTVSVEAPGFQKWVSSRNVLSVGTPAVINATLELGPVTSVVQVESTYERLETANATISDVMTENQVKNLPLNGRNPLTLLTLEPGVVQRTFGGAGSGTHVFGSRDRAHNITIDGIDANESTVPNPQSNIQRLNPDNVQEFRAVTLGATAETGRNSGANVMVATKAGSNSFHGSAYYFNRNTAYNSNEWFTNFEGLPRANLKLNQAGFDVGGHAIKDKTFYFGSFQGNKIQQTAAIASVLGVPTVYTPSALSGVFRFVRGIVTTTDTNRSFSANSLGMVDANGNLRPGINLCAGVLGGTATTNCVDGYNMFSTANMAAGLTGADPAVIALLRSLPAPNNFTAAGDGLNTGGFNWAPPTKFAGPHTMVRVDHKFGPNDNIFVRWLQNHFNTTQGDFINGRPIVYPGFPPLGEVGRLGKNLSISYRHTFSPTLVNEYTSGFNRFRFSFTFGESNPGFGDPTKDPPWADDCIYGSFSNVTGPYCVSPHTQRAITAPQFIDNLTWSHGAHTIRTGINFRFYIHNDSRGFFGGTILAPGVLFSNSGSSGRRGNFLNIPSTASSVPAAQRPASADTDRLQQAIVEMFGMPFRISQSYRADFASDRYVSAQYATVYTRAHQYDYYIQDEWRVRRNLTLNLGLRWEFNPSPFDKFTSLVPNHPLDGSQGPVSFVKADSWYDRNNWKAFAPRVGVAWSLGNKMVVRSGYALLFDTISTFQVTAIAGKMPGFMLGCSTTVTTSGTISTAAGCAAPSGMTNRISTGFPLSIPAPTTTPSAVQSLFQVGQGTGQAPAIGAFDQNMKNPAVHEWNLAVQRELWQHFVAEVAYIGKRGTHLQRAYDINQGNLSPAFVNSFNIARANFLAGCNSDGTGCPAGVTGTTPTLLLTLVPASFLNSTSATTIRRGDIGGFAASLDGLAANNANRLSALTFNYFRPNGQYGQIFYQDSGGDSYYHAMYVAVRRRFEKGLDLGFAYTFSKSIDALSADPTGAATGGGLSQTSFQRTPTDVRNFRLDRSLSDFNNTHVVQTNILYEFPIGKGKRFASSVPGWLNQIIGGWTWTSIFLYQSGEPYTISAGVRTSNLVHNSTALVVGPNIRGQDLQFVSGVEGPVQYQVNPSSGVISTPLNDPHLNCINVNTRSTFFCIPPPGTYGTGRNNWQGPHYWNLDAGLLKVFHLTERLNIQFRAEAFNALNHPNFENPRNSTTGSATITSTLFGQTCCATAAVASAQTVNPIGEPMRVLQLGLKVNW